MAGVEVSLSCIKFSECLLSPCWWLWQLQGKLVEESRDISKHWNWLVFFSAVTSTLLLHKLNSWMCLVLCCATWAIASRFCNFFVKLVGRLNHWLYKSWQLWVAIIYFGLFLQSCEKTWTELCLRVNCASPHIRVDEVLASCYRLLDIHASEVLWTPWQCSLPGRVYIKIHPDTI